MFAAALLVSGFPPHRVSGRLVYANSDAYR